MDHRCLYGHRVPVTFAYAIQSRSCPTCGAPTVTLNGYQAARKLAAEGGIEAVAAFNALRLLETEWVLSPVAAAAPAPTPGPALGPAEAAAAPPEDEVVVVDDDAAAAAVPPEPRITPKIRSEGKREKVEARPEPAVSAPPANPGVGARTDFGKEEEDFFKGA